MSETIRQKAMEAENGRASAPKTKRQTEKETLRLQAEQLRKKSITAIYRQLAKILHPDLERDAARRERKVVLMQELTTAYRSSDLHTLLRLELEWIHGEAGLARLTDETLTTYNQILRDQVKALEQELWHLSRHPRYLPLAALRGPFGLSPGTDPEEQAVRLDETIADFGTMLERMRNRKSLNVVRSVIREHRYVMG
jgi:hypothetical protein